MPIEDVVYVTGTEKDPVEMLTPQEETALKAYLDAVSDDKLNEVDPAIVDLVRNVWIVRKENGNLGPVFKNVIVSGPEFRRPDYGDSGGGAV